MKLEINAVPLADAAAFAAKSISARPVNPAMSGILITAEPGTLSLTGSDYDAVSTATVEADIEQPGTALLHSGMFTNIVQKMKGRNVSLELDDGRVTIRAGASRYVLPNMGIADYPDISALPPTAGVVDGQALTEALSRIVGAVGDDKGGVPVLTGIRIQAVNDLILLHATNKYQLAEEAVAYKGEPFAATVPGAYMVAAAKGLMGETALLADDNRFGLRSGNRQTASNIMGGDYPKIGGLFPVDTPIRFTADRAEFLGALDRAMVVVDRESQIDIAITGGEATITSGDGERSGSETLAAEANEEIDVRFNPSFLRWALAQTPGERVRIGFAKVGMPAYITADADLPDSRKLVMPIRK